VPQEPGEGLTPHVGRHRTAMRRVRCSRPVGLAHAEGLIEPGRTFFDYGCGHGGDVRFLAAHGIQASGWDPHFAPDVQVTPADVVNLGYVLNVIENPKERLETLEKAYAAANYVLIVSVRVDNTLEDAVEFGDGVVTGKGTFQKIFTQDEFKTYIESSLGRRPHTASLGVLYVFKNDAAEQRYVASKAFTRRLEYRTDLIALFERDEVARKLISVANELGRVPRLEEFEQYPQLFETFGSPQRVERLLLSRIDRETFDDSRAERRNDMLVYIALLRLQRIAPPPFKALPSPVQADVRAIWGSYERALKEGIDFLFTLGTPQAVKMACSASTVGKLLPGDLYVHRSAEDDIPALARVIVAAAKQIVGELDYDLVKIALDGRAVAFLQYPGFNEVAHPALRRSIRVYLPKASWDVRDYSSSVNAPILHRKETLVSAWYPRRAEFAALTKQEEKYGLLSNGDIGFRVGWEALLKAYRLEIEGHSIRSLI
jgi:DNA phosphorothioation-associated putative methyltransferase